MFGSIVEELKLFLVLNVLKYNPRIGSNLKLKSLVFSSPINF